LGSFDFVELFAVVEVAELLVVVAFFVSSFGVPGAQDK